MVHRNVVDGSNIIGFPIVIADSEQDMPGNEPGLLGWHKSALTTELQEVRQLITFYIKCLNYLTYNKLGRNCTIISFLVNVRCICWINVDNHLIWGNYLFNIFMINLFLYEALLNMKRCKIILCGRQVSKLNINQFYFLPELHRTEKPRFHKIFVLTTGEHFLTYCSLQNKYLDYAKWSPDDNIKCAA